MATQTGIYFIGRKGNIIGSTWKGIPYLRSMPDSICQSEATKRSSSYMGTASGIGAGMRRMFDSLLPEPKSKAMQNRFTGACKKWLQTGPLKQPSSGTALPFLTAFEFNEQSPVKERLKVAITLMQDSEWRLFIPAFVPTAAITAPAGTAIIQLNIAAACYNVGTMVSVGMLPLSCAMAYNANIVPACEIILPFTPAGGNLILVAMALQYSRSDGNYITDERWRPCGIVAGGWEQV